MNREQIESDVHRWFFEYVETFIRCASSPSPDVEALQRYFHAPTWMTTDTVFLSIGTREQVGAILGNELSQLAKADYGGSQAIDPVIQVFNQRSAMVTVTWARSDRNGVEFQRMRVSYVVACTDLGWKIVASAVHGKTE